MKITTTILITILLKPLLRKPYQKFLEILINTPLNNPILNEINELKLRQFQWQLLSQLSNASQSWFLVRGALLYLISTATLFLKFLTEKQRTFGEFFLKIPPPPTRQPTSASL